MIIFAAGAQAFLIIVVLTMAAEINIYILEAPPFALNYFEMVETSYIFDHADNEIAALFGEQNRVYKRLEETPEHVQNAFLAVEDRRFYDHSGFDFFGSGRALIANLHRRGITQGASTITQQLARNVFLPPDRTVRRKIQEIWLALLIEREFNKAQILEMYLNLIYFGNGAYGVESAARTYFNKHIEDVTLAEAALLAGIVCAPNALNPFSSEAETEKRAKTALQMMRDHGYLSPAQYHEAVSYEYSYAAQPAQQYPFPYFLDYVIHHELLKLLAVNPEIGSMNKAYQTIYTGGLRVYTTLDQELQAHAESVLNQSKLYPQTHYLDMSLLKEKIRANEFTPGQINEFIDTENGVTQPQAALVLADPVNGQVLALVGGRDYRKQSNEILRYLSLRQPGSALKPLVVYAPAFEEKVLTGAGNMIDDGPLTIGQWVPRNYDGTYHGLVTARRALAYSYNVAAIRIFQSVTPSRGTRYAERMGISTFTDVDRQILSTALGGITYGVSAFDMAQAYSVLANEGLKTELHTIRRIEDSQGRLIYEYKANPEKILSEESTFLVTSILMDVVNHTTATGIRSSRPIAAKTGTTDQARDIYLVAYTPNLVVSFWMGYDEPRLGGIPRGWEYSSRFVREIVHKAFEQIPAAEFIRPPGLSAQIICKESGKLANEFCREEDVAITDLFFSSHIPWLTCDLHQEPPDKNGSRSRRRQEDD